MKSVFGKAKIHWVFFSALVLFGALLFSLLFRPSLRQEARAPGQALEPVRFFYPKFMDDMGVPSLTRAIERNLVYLNKLPSDHMFQYGSDQFSCRQVRETQEAFLELISNVSDPKALRKRIKKEYRAYRAAGRIGNRRVLFTGYFEPLLEASLTPDASFKYPLYKPPEDLIKVDLSPFSEALRGKSIVARIEGKKVLPYFERAQIENSKVLAGKGLEIAWLKDPVDVAFLQIQGSGRLQLKQGGRLGVGYAAKNGRPFRSIGRYLLDKGLLSRKELSMQRIRRFLSDHPERLDEVLNHNPSYVFFRVLGDGPVVGNIGVPLTPGRSLALDYRLFPKGALAFISLEKPVVNDKGKITDWKDFSRFVLNQDTGGAIRGAGRADLFWGSGPYAEVAAGHTKHDGDLYILIKKP